MPLPTPEPGRVIHYEYLWRHEYEAGEEEGSKQRPCAIIVAVTDSEGKTETVVAPITHRRPVPPSIGIEIPPRVKSHLGLDDKPSWVITTDLNTFEWPGPDLYPVPGARRRFDYGLLPPRLFEQIRASVEKAGGISIATPRTT